MSWCKIKSLFHLTHITQSLLKEDPVERWTIPETKLKTHYKGHQKENHTIFLQTNGRSRVYHCFSAKMFLCFLSYSQECNYLKTVLVVVLFTKVLGLVKSESQQTLQVL